MPHDPAPIPSHYVMDEFRQAKMINLRNAMRGIAAICHDGLTATARLDVGDVAKEDLSALFTLFADHVDMLTGDMLFVYSKDAPAGPS